MFEQPDQFPETARRQIPGVGAGQQPHVRRKSVIPLDASILKELASHKPYVSCLSRRRRFRGRDVLTRASSSLSSFSSLFAVQARRRATHWSSKRSLGRSGPRLRRDWTESVLCRIVTWMGWGRETSWISRGRARERYDRNAVSYTVHSRRVYFLLFLFSALFFSPSSFCLPSSLPLFLFPNPPLSPGRNQLYPLVKRARDWRGSKLGVAETEERATKGRGGLAGSFQAQQPLLRREGWI